MNCPPVSEYSAAVESGELPSTLELHLAECEACSELFDGLKNESDSLSISIAELWARERISCPHDDILLSWLREALDSTEQEFIGFHLDVVGCPHCQARAEELRVELERDRKSADAAMERAKDRSMRSTQIFFRDHPK